MARLNAQARRRGSKLEDWLGGDREPARRSAAEAVRRASPSVDGRRRKLGAGKDRKGVRARRRGADAERQATPHGTLVKALARAWRWQKLLDAGVYTSATEIAEAEGIGKSYVSRILRLALLALDVVEGIVEGRADQALMLEGLERPLPPSWGKQRRVILGGGAA